MEPKANLLKKSYDELYNLYEAKNTTDEYKQRLLEVVEEKKGLDGIDESFQALPEYKQPNFQDIIFKKKEFNTNQLLLDTSGFEDVCEADFSIKGHQSFLKNFMTKESPYKSILIYHGVGVGKTCSGVTIAENFRDPYARKERRILILSSKNIQIGWKKTIYDPLKDENQCTGEAFVNSGAKSDREINKLVKQYYELMAYQSFSNFVKRLVSTYIQKLPDSEKEQGKIECIKEYFSNRLLIIDEAHNIRDEQGNDMRDAVKTIEKVLRYSENLRLVLLTATPMYNRATEIVWILNMMLLNDGRPLINKKDVFTNEGLLSQKGKQILKEKSRGYISYLRGENPITFPIRLYPTSIKTDRGSYFKDYQSKENVSIITKSKAPSKNLVGGVIRDKLSFLELFGTKLRGFQEKIYQKSVKNLIESGVDLDVRGDMNPILDTISMTQMTNIVYPVNKDIDDTSIDEFYGERGFNQCFNKDNGKYSYKKACLDKFGPFLDKDHLPKYSSKIASILDTIDKSEGIVFIYTSYVNSGILPLQLALEQNGYSRFGGKTLLKYPNFKQGAGDKTKREPRSYDGKLRSKAGERYKPASYMVIDASTPKKTLQDQLKIVNSYENKNGQRIKIILGTVVASEGLDFKCIRSIHIMDPWLHLNRMEQTVGRGIRFCSHKPLPDYKKNVLIYLHSATLSNDRESIDTSIYRYAERKSLQIGEVETILKLEAVDRYLYKDVNVITKNDIDTVVMVSPLKYSRSMVIQPSDKPYSKVCSYSPECDYNKDISESKYDDYNPEINTHFEDTFLEQYSSSTLHNLKKKISLLYKQFYVFDVDAILGLLHEYGHNLDTMIYTALHEMVIHKFTVYDKYGNSGYLINVNKYYVFQPSMLDDTMIPLYYRMNLLHRNQQIIKLPRLNVREPEPEFSAQYSVESIQRVIDSFKQTCDIYQSSVQYPDVHDISEKISNKLSNYPELLNRYLFDRLSLSDKCALMYMYIQKINCQPSMLMDDYLGSLLIYKDPSKTEFYFNSEPVSNKQLFGFALSYNNKPRFFEIYEGDIVACNSVQLRQLDKSFKRYKKTPHYKKFYKNDIIWGYSILRKRKYEMECVMKFVEPNKKGKPLTTKFPPGPGNVCIENNIGSRIDNLLKIIDERYQFMSSEASSSPLLMNKKNTCFLLEILLRSSNSYYPLDKVWLKYSVNLI